MIFNAINFFKVILYCSPFGEFFIFVIFKMHKYYKKVNIMKKIHEMIFKLNSCNGCEMYKNNFCDANEKDHCNSYQKLMEFAEFILTNEDFQKKNTMKNK